MKKRIFLVLLALVVGCGGVALAQNKAAVSGTSQGSEAPLIGIFYDFKQNQKREPIPMDRPKFDHLIAEFIDNDWDESLLKDFYRVSNPLYRTDLFIDTINSDDGRKAFGAEMTVKPRMWMVPYMCQVLPPADGI